MKLCECGCGQPTTIAPKTQRSEGVVAGQARRFIFGHRRPLPTVAGYPETSAGKVHRLRAEAALGKPLPPTAVVHHPDEDPANPRARLVICQNQAYHRQLHGRRRIQQAGGNPWTDRICSRCHLVKHAHRDFAMSRGHYGGRDIYCRLCKKIINARAHAKRARRA